MADSTPPAAPAAGSDQQSVLMRQLASYRTDGTLLPNTANTDVACVMATVHNWVEHVYAVFGQMLPTEPNKVALLGMREATLEEGPSKKGQTEADKLQSAEQGADTGVVKVDTETRTGDATKNTSVTFNDLLYMVWTDTDAAHEQHVEVFKCTVDPGDDEKSGTTGTPYLLEGKLYKGYASTHNPSKYPGSPALHLYTDTHEHITVARDATKKTEILDKVECALVKAASEVPGCTSGTAIWEFCAQETNGSIHMHFSRDASSPGDLVKNWSTGCTVLRHDRFSARYLVFGNKCKGAANSTAIPYIVVSSAYMKTYTEWQSAIADKSIKPGDAAGVLKRDKLVARDDDPKSYIPSIATKDFVKNVLAFAKRVTDAGGDTAQLASDQGYINPVTPATATNPHPTQPRPRTAAQQTTGAANIVASVNRMCFTISV